MAIDLHLTMQIEESENVSITFNGELFYSGPAPTGVPSLDITFDNFESCNDSQIVDGIVHVIRHLKIGCAINIASDIPLGCGLGTSAAASISLAMGCLTLANYKHSLNLSPLQLESRCYQLAHELDNFIHGQGSGIDVLTCFYGGVQYYNGTLKENGTISKYCTPLDLELPKIHVIYSRIPKDTRQMVSNVSKQYNIYPKVILSIMNTIDELISCVLNGTNIMDVANYSHDMLASLGVSHTKLQLGIDLLKQCDVACKLTGSGGGGCLLSFGDLSSTNIAMLNSHAFDVYPVSLSKRGVEIKEIK